MVDNGIKVLHSLSFADLHIIFSTRHHFSHDQLIFIDSGLVLTTGSTRKLSAVTTNGYMTRYKDSCNVHGSKYLLDFF